MTHKEYNGWYNYETWLVNLWMGDEEPSWREATRTVCHGAYQKDTAIRKLEELLKSEHEEAMPELKGLSADLLNAALSEVNWYEIAENMVNDYAADNPEVFAESEHAEEKQ